MHCWTINISGLRQHGQSWRMLGARNLIMSHRFLTPALYWHRRSTLTKCSRHQNWLEGNLENPFFPGFLNNLLWPLSGAVGFPSKHIFPSSKNSSTRWDHDCIFALWMFTFFVQMVHLLFPFSSSKPWHFGPWLCILSFPSLQNHPCILKLLSFSFERLMMVLLKLFALQIFRFPAWSYHFHTEI